MNDLVTKWILWTAVPTVGGLVIYLYRRLIRRRGLIAYLNALPSDCHAILRRFIDERSHTVVLVPGTPPVCILERDGIISKKASAGTYDAVAYFFTLRQDVFDIVTESIRHPVLIGSGRQNDKIG